MPFLHLLRHAKSSWDDPELSDERRPLAARGERAARNLGALMRREKLRPELVLCSPAVRARQTLELVVAELGRPLETRVERDLYGAGEAELLGRLRRLPVALQSVLVVGHNPGLQELAMRLAEPEGQLYRRLERKFPTCALASFVLRTGGWRSLGAERTELVRLIRPRDISL